MVKVKLRSGLKTADRWFKPGDTFEGEAEVVAALIASGAAHDPKAAAESSVDTSEDILAEARTNAEALVAKAKVQPDNAKVEADKIVKDAEEAAKAVKEAKPASSTK